MTLAAVVQRCASELGMVDRTDRSEPLAAILQRCMDEIGLSGPPAGSSITLRQRAAAVAAELEIATGWK